MSVSSKLNKLKLLAYDFDGVMTDNTVFIDQKGNESVRVNRSDGLAISKIKALDIEQIIISTEKNKLVAVRSKKLGLNCFFGVNDKKQTLIEYCKQKKISISSVGFVGNDINDLDVMSSCGVSICPVDAYDAIKKISDYCLTTKGGKGVVREIYNLILIELDQYI